MSEIKLLPGSAPNMERRGFDLKGTDTLVNDLGGNSQVYPERLVEVRESIVPGQDNVWYEYAPEGLDTSKPVPLVISFHGGGMEGWGQCIFTGWTMIADREGFVCVFPTANANRAWNVNMGTDLIDRENNPDILFTHALIEKLTAKYNIDPERIYLQGMSMGDLMTVQCSRAFGHRIAAAACAAGPSDPDSLLKDGVPQDHDGPVQIWQYRGEKDSSSRFPAYDRQQVNAANRHFWMKVNGCAAPELSIDGYNNFAFYKGEKANLVYRDVKFRGHGQTLDDAELAWSMMFSGTRRLSNGTIVRQELPSGDKGAIALCDGCSAAYADNKRVELLGKTYIGTLNVVEMFTNKHVETLEFLYAPLADAAKLFGFKYEKDGRSATLRTDCGHSLTFASESVCCLADGKLISMCRKAELVDGELYIPIRWLAENILHRFVTECDGAMYIADHPGHMTKDMAVIIKELVG